MSRYRCTACREYFTPPAYRKMGVGSVCSQECMTGLSRTRRAVTQARVPDKIPPAVRAAVGVRDGQRCRYCGRNQNLHEHHIRYRSEGVDHSEDNLIVLCGEHHDLVHSNKRRWQPVCQAYIVEVNGGRRRFLADIDRELSARA